MHGIISSLSLSAHENPGDGRARRAVEAGLCRPISTEAGSKGRGRGRDQDPPTVAAAAPDAARPRSEESGAGEQSRAAQTQEENMTGNGGSWALLSVFLVLAVFCNYGGTLKCYSCSLTRYGCNTSITCPSEKNACLKLSVGETHSYDCYKFPLCDDEDIEKEFKVFSFKFKCCQWDLCNKGVANMVTKTALVPSSLMAVIWSLYF
ncbi:CD59 glycoprotein [Ornithorhynchus anatinus]|uniref:CD59 glycoprotein n=1 Tax=Ornithorhynchus anatinus TaxID=9258 RepID=UPI0010A7EEB7|nr:CD59 glycoprotein [Ornithorhynchus anatinus]